MKETTIIRLLISIRDQIDAILEEYAGKIEETSQQKAKCDHPMEYRLNLSVLGSNVKRYKCKICDYEWTEEINTNKGEI